MSQVLFGLAVLACPLGMGLMMWLMMRGGHGPTAAAASLTDNRAELARLRAEIDQLQAAQRDAAPAAPPTGASL